MFELIRGELLIGRCLEPGHEPHAPPRLDVLYRDLGPNRHVEPEQGGAPRLHLYERVHRLRIAGRDTCPYGLFATALGTGARQGELLALRWSDVDLDAPRITIRGSLQRGADGRLEIAETKTHRSRRPLVPPALVVDALREHRVRQLREKLLAGSRWDGSLDLVFPNSIGRPSDAPVVTRRLQAICKQAGLPRVTFHSLRHSAATFLLGSGTPARIVADVLGHSTTRLLDVYAHVLDEYRHEAARRMDAILGGAR